MRLEIIRSIVIILCLVGLYDPSIATPGYLMLILGLFVGGIVIEHLDSNDFN